MKRAQFLNHNQKNTNACVAFAACNIIHFHTKEKIDPLFLFKKARREMPDDNSGLNLNAIRKALKNYYDFTKVTATLQNIKYRTAIGDPLVLSVKVQEIDPKQNQGYHAVVAYKVEGDTIYYVNSWEPTWGPFNDNSGYFKYRPGIINWAFEISPNKNKTK